MRKRSNGGVECDVIEGPCACGAWHRPSERIVVIRNGKRFETGAIHPSKETR